MPNICSVGVRAVFPDRESALAYWNELSSRNAESGDRGLDMGAPGRRVSDTDLRWDGGCVVNVCGGVAWVVEEVDAKDIVAFACSFLRKPLELTIDYEESMEGVFGRYTYTRRPDQANGVLKDRYIPEDDWPSPEDTENGSEIYVVGDRLMDRADALSETLKRHGVEKDLGSV